MSRMTDSADPVNLFLNQQQYGWENFSHKVHAHFPDHVASSEPRYPYLSQNPGALYG